MRTSRAFTLYEALVTLFLVFLVLGLLAELVNRQQKVVRFSEDKEGLLTVEDALIRMENEYREATGLLLPATVLNPSDRLRLEKVDPVLNGAPARPGDRLPQPPVAPASFDPQDPAWKVTVEYGVNNGVLERRVNGVAFRLAEGVESLTVERDLGDDLLLDQCADQRRPATGGEGQSPMSHRRGVTLILVLLVSTLLLVWGMALLSRRGLEAEGVKAQIDSRQAYEIAYAGLESVRLRLDKDPEFPPAGRAEQKVFSFVEELEDVDGAPMGSYLVNVDSTWIDEPWYVLRVESIGTSIGGTSIGGTRRRLLAEFDMSEFIRGTTNPNPDYFERINFQDLGNL